MKTQEILNLLEKANANDHHSMIYFKLPTRIPLFGKFVKHKDHEELLKKGMIRFLSHHNYDMYEITKGTDQTRIIVLDSLNYVKNWITYEQQA